MTQQTRLYKVEPYTLERFLERTAKLAREQINRAKLDKTLNQLVGKILENVPAKDWKAEIEALFRFVKSKLRYRKDPDNIELVKYPGEALIYGGDCDDFSTSLGALLEIAGHPVSFVSVSNRPDKTLHHLILKVYGFAVDADESERVLAFSDYVREKQITNFKEVQEMSAPLQLAAMGNLTTQGSGEKGLDQAYFEYYIKKRPEAQGFFGSIVKSVSKAVSSTVKAVASVASTAASSIASVAKTIANTAAKYVSNPLQLAEDLGKTVYSVAGAAINNQFAVINSLVKGDLKGLYNTVKGNIALVSTVVPAAGALKAALDIIENPKSLLEPESLLKIASQNIPGVPADVVAYAKLAYKAATNPAELLDPQNILKEVLAANVPEETLKKVETLIKAGKDAKAVVEEALSVVGSVAANTLKSVVEEASQAYSENKPKIDLIEKVNNVIQANPAYQSVKKMLEDVSGGNSFDSILQNAASLPDMARAEILKKIELSKMITSPQLLEQVKTDIAKTLEKIKEEQIAQARKQIDREEYVKDKTTFIELPDDIKAVFSKMAQAITGGPDLSVQAQRVFDLVQSNPAYQQIKAAEAQAKSDPATTQAEKEKFIAVAQDKKEELVADAFRQYQDELAIVKTDLSKLRTEFETHRGQAVKGGGLFSWLKNIFQ